MEKNNYLPKSYITKDAVLLELMEDYPAFSDKESAAVKQKILKEELEVQIRVIPFNGTFLLYRVLVNKKLKKI